MNKRLRWLSVTAAPVLMAIMAMQVHAVDPENVGSRVEDDAWYDVTEWFDGNDYNPTGEAIGRWDNETFDYRDKQTSTDSDNDNELVSAEEIYGKDYDDGHSTWSDNDKDGNYETMTRYHDTDGDRLNDSYATYRDENKDGMYENYVFTELGNTPKNAVHSSKVAQSTQKGLSGKSHQVTGTVAETKIVQRDHAVSLLVKVDDTDGKVNWVDFGSNGASLQLFKGDEFTASGPVVKRGNKNVLVATSIQRDGKQRKITRHGRRYIGTVESTKKAKVRGNEHLVVKLKTDDGKKMTVDMGNPSSAKNVQEGNKVTVTGVPVKVGDRVILIADKTQS